MPEIDNEMFVLHGKETGRRIIDFFAWWSGGMMTNLFRGVLAEYIVAMALDCDKQKRLDAWGPFDLVTPQGLRVEVKASAYLQAWTQSKPSKIVFSIRPSKEYDYKTGIYSESNSRKSDVYVFCVFECMDKGNAKLSDLDQWGFYVMKTEEINRLFGSQKTVSLGRILSAGARRVSFSELTEAVSSIRGD